jgi:hypothetical protein
MFRPSLQSKFLAYVGGSEHGTAQESFGAQQEPKLEKKGLSNMKPQTSLKNPSPLKTFAVRYCSILVSQSQIAHTLVRSKKKSNDLSSSCKWTMIVHVQYASCPSRRSFCGCGLSRAWVWAAGCKGDHLQATISPPSLQSQNTKKLR